MKFLSKTAIVFDDHLLFGDSFSALLERTKKFQRVYAVNEYESVVNCILRDVKAEIFLFLDYYLADGVVGVKIINDLRRLRKDINIIIVSSVTNPATIQMIKSYDPDAIISKSSGFNTIIKCLQLIEKGEKFYCSYISNILEKSLNEKIVTFSPRELEVLKYFSQGLSVIETAKKLIISKHTVVSHRRNMMKKTQSKTIVELLSYVREHGIM